MTSIYTVLCLTYWTAVAAYNGYFITVSDVNAADLDPIVFSECAKSCIRSTDRGCKGFSLVNNTCQLADCYIKATVSFEHQVNIVASQIHYMNGSNITKGLALICTHVLL